MAHHGTPRIRSWSSLLLFVIGAHARLALMAMQRSPPCYETWCGDLLPLQFALCLQAVEFYDHKTCARKWKTASLNSWPDCWCLRSSFCWSPQGLSFSPGFYRGPETNKYNWYKLQLHDEWWCCNSLTLLNYTGHPCVTVQYHVQAMAAAMSAIPTHVHLLEMQNSWDSLPAPIQKAKRKPSFENRNSYVHQHIGSWSATAAPISQDVSPETAMPSPSTDPTSSTSAPWEEALPELWSSQFHRCKSNSYIAHLIPAPAPWNISDVPLDHNQR